MTDNLLIKAYKKKKVKYGADAYKHITDIFKEAEEKHKAKSNETGRLRDLDQSWRSYKGKNFEKLIKYIIEDEVRKLSLEVISGNRLERKLDKNFSDDLARVKRNLLIDYGEYGCHLPDVDIVIYNPKTVEIKAVISVKVTLRERVAQSGYWKLKMQSQNITKHIKFYFVTADSDGTLKTKSSMKKGRAIVEADMDGSYILGDVEESDKVKGFDKFIEDLRKLKL